MDFVTLLVITAIIPAWIAAQEMLYFDVYGSCNRGGYFPVEEVATKVKARGGAAYKTKICEIRFRSKPEEQICVIFDRYDVKDRVQLMVYDGNSATGSPMYSFGPDSTPSPFCSTGRYLTLKLDKGANFLSTNYQFELRIMEESRAEFVNGLDGFVMSIGVIIAIIIGVVILIIVCGIVIVCCCCKRTGNNQEHHGGLKLKRQPGPSQGNDNQQPPIEPSAPPLHEMHYGRDGYHSVPIQDRYGVIQEPPPAYSAEPPPYTSTEIHS